MKDTTYSYQVDLCAIKESSACPWSITQKENNAIIDLTAIHSFIHPSAAEAKGSVPLSKCREKVQKIQSPTLGLEPRTFTLGGRWNIHFPTRAPTETLNGN